MDVTCLSLVRLRISLLRVLGWLGLALHVAILLVLGDLVGLGGVLARAHQQRRPPRLALCHAMQWHRFVFIPGPRNDGKAFVADGSWLLMDGLVICTGRRVC